MSVSPHGHRAGAAPPKVRRMKKTFQILEEIARHVGEDVATSDWLTVTQAQVDSGQYQADVLRLDFHTNPRAKMSGAEEGFVKIFARQGSGTVIGGVVVSPRASELIYALALAVTHKLHVDDLADTFTVYPSMSGSIAEAARRLHVRI